MGPHCAITLGDIWTTLGVKCLPGIRPSVARPDADPKYALTKGHTMAKKNVTRQWKNRDCRIR